MLEKKKSLAVVLLITVLALAGPVTLAGAAQPGRAPEGVPFGMSAGSANAAASTTAEHNGVGPDEFPAGVNPLTGQAVENPSLLNLPPAMVSVTNFPVSARPQAGLSSAAYVFEMYIGMGMTRYLALFYGNYPTTKTAKSALANQNAAIGPIRSGRLPYESVRKLYNGALVMAGASAEVGAHLNSSATVFGSDKDNINSALIDVSRLQKIAEANQKTTPGLLNLTGNRFEADVPQNGEAAQSAQIFYNFYNQIRWNYDSAAGAYLRSQDKADGSGKFYPTTDRLSGKQLAFENVVVLFAQHTAVKPTIIDIDLLYTIHPAILFRDGQAYRIFWTTANGEYEKTSKRLRPIRFIDADGNPFPLKPGHTWVEMVTDTTTVQEKTPGEWNVRFFAPR